ncbi:MAG: homoserine kinase [Peptococcaceae bacterium]|nr:homoserine kinase [Peptococcaceae bacterium]
MVKVRVPATTANLGPGFDCLGLALSLYNTVEMLPSHTWGIEIGGEGVGDLPLTSDNLVWKAACRLWFCAGVVPPSITLRLHNEIPLSRGLGSSSAAIIGGLMAANTFVPEPLTAGALLDLATEIEGHPDNVAPALLGGAVASVTQGSRVTAVPLRVYPALMFVVCVPDFKLSTHLARKALPATVPYEDAVFNLSRSVIMTKALELGDSELLSLASQDRLHQPYRQYLIPGFAVVCTNALRQGAAAVMLSGAGPTMLAIVTHADASAVGQSMVAGFAMQGITSRFQILEQSSTGASIVQ